MEKSVLTLQEMQSNSIRWAAERIGETGYAGWCLKFVEDAIEQSNQIEIFGGDCAKESCRMYQDALHPGQPERGSVVFYDCLCPTPHGKMDWGHCGIAAEGGMVLHAWDQVRKDDYLDVEKLTVGGEHPVYLGWVPLARVLQQKP